MTAQEALKAAVRELLVPFLREHGFKGSSPTWRQSNTQGDWAVVNLQSSSYSTRDNPRCVLNIAVAPEPWLRWSAVRQDSGMPKAVGESLGLYRDRLHPAGTPAGADGWWEVSDASSARAAVEDMVVQLQSNGLPILQRLLDPGELLVQVRADNLGWMKREHQGVFFSRAEALLLMDAGPSAALEKHLNEALTNVTETQRANALHFDGWVRQQSARARHG